MISLSFGIFKSGLQTFDGWVGRSPILMRGSNLMSTDNNNNKDFARPKLSLRVILISGLLPVIIAALPFLLSRDSLAEKDIAIIILAILCAGLVVCVISLTLDSYDEAYKRQVLEIKIESMGNDLSEFMNHDLKKIISEVDSLAEKVGQHEKIHSSDPDHD